MDDFNFGDLDFSTTDFGTPVQPAPVAPVAQAPVQPMVQPMAQPVAPVQPAPVAPVQPVPNPIPPQAPVQPMVQPMAQPMVQPVTQPVQAVNLDQAASEAENFTIAEVPFGQRVSASPIEAYKAVAGISNRIRFVSDKPIPIKAHYLAKEVPALGKRSIICTGGSCCQFGDPYIKYAFGIIVYPTIPGSKPMQADPSQKPQLKVLLAGTKLYQQLIDIYENNGTIMGYDFGLSNAQQGNWVTTNCVVATGDWSSQFPTMQEEINKWEKLKGKCWQAVGNYKTEAEIKQALQQANYTPPAQPDYQLSDFGI